MKERLKMAKYKEPKEQIVTNLDERKKKTDYRKQLFSLLGSSFENMFNEEKQISTKENSDMIRESKDSENNVHREESAAVKSKWYIRLFYELIVVIYFILF